MTCTRWCFQYLAMRVWRYARHQTHLVLGVEPALLNVLRAVRERQVPDHLQHAHLRPPGNKSDSHGVGRWEVADHTTPGHLFDRLVIGKQLLAVVFLVLGRLSAVDYAEPHVCATVTAIHNDD